ncbi:MAG TPA: MFS transporter [Thermoplasmata archaeon]|nr:MFS transporter [Thermoplasmata archaeon]
MADALPARAEADRRSLRAVYVATFFVRFSFGTTLAVFVSYITGHSSGFSSSEFGTAGIVSALAPIGEFSTVLASGAAADRWGRYPVLFGAMAAAAGLFALVATSRDPLVLGAANFLFGIASGGILAASLAVVADRAEADERGHEMGRFDAVNLFGWVAGFAFGLGALGTLPNRSLGLVFAIGASALLAGLAAALLLVRGSPSFRPRTPPPLRTVFASAFRRTVLVVTLPWLAIYCLLGTVLAFLGPAASGVGISDVYIALAIGGGGSLLVVTQPYFGRLADRTGRTRMMTVGATGFVLLLVFASLAIAYGPVWPVLVGIGACVLPALSYGPAALAALADLARELSRATTMAVYSLTISLGMFVGILASTQLVAHFGNVGLYPYFGAIAAVIAGLTAIRWAEARRLKIPVR